MIPRTLGGKNCLELMWDTVSSWLVGLNASQCGCVYASIWEHYTANRFFLQHRCRSSKSAVVVLLIYFQFARISSYIPVPDTRADVLRPFSLFLPQLLCTTDYAARADLFFLVIRECKVRPGNF